jgi:hypothetical protein
VRRRRLLTLGLLAAFALGTKLPDLGAQPNTIHGTVASARDGSAIRDARVLGIWAQSSQPLPLTLSFAEAVTAADGGFSLTSAGGGHGGPTSAVHRSVVVFHPMYEPHVANIGSDVPVRIALDAAKTEPAERAQSLLQMPYVLGLALATLESPNRPLMLEALDKQWRTLPDDVRTPKASLATAFDWFRAEFRSQARGEPVTSAPHIAGFPPPTYAAPAIRLTVVDFHSRQPLAGVVVVAQWLPSAYGRRGQQPLHLAESVSDANGVVSFMAWGPLGRPPLAQLTDRSPELVVFKSGYHPLVLRNDPRFAARYPNYAQMTSHDISSAMGFDGQPDKPLQTVFWHSKVVTLESFTDTPARWLVELGHIVDRVQDPKQQLTALPKAVRSERDIFRTMPRRDIDQRKLDWVFWSVDRKWPTR